jgi:hypothetical protein
VFTGVPKPSKINLVTHTLPVSAVNNASVLY